MLLAVLLGERKLPTILLFPVLILTAIYVIFELGLQIRLPKADFFSSLPL